MNWISKAYGHFLRGLGKAIEGILGFLIAVFSVLVDLVDGIKKIIISVLVMGCFFVFLSPLLLALLLKPGVIAALVFFVLFPLVGTILVSFLRYQQYVLTEYLYDHADHYINGKKTAGGFADYQQKYQRMQEENYRKDQEEKQRAEYERKRAEQEMWERVFREFFEQAQRGGPYRGGAYGGTGAGGAGSPYQNPLGEFVSRYENACRVLGVGTDADVYQIKLAYRKMAKQYHPDLNPAPDATEKFQKINAAFEFLNEENIKRYKSIKK